VPAESSRAVGGAVAWIAAAAPERDLRLLADLHDLLAYAALAAALATLLVAVVGTVAGGPVRIWLDRLILLTLAALAAAALSGLPLALLAGLPADVLHLVYGLSAPLVLLAGRYLGRRGSLHRRSLLVALATLALLGVIYRLFTTASPG
jgi:hypothetical protein